MDKIKTQANKVGELIFAPETGATYKKAFGLTWDILRETGVLLWLSFCFLFVGVEWFYRTSVQLGRNARVWYNGLKEKQGEAATEEQTLGSTGKALLDAGQSGAAFLLSRARQQLGMPEPEPTPTPAPKVTPPVTTKPTTPVPKTEASTSKAATAATPEADSDSEAED